MFILIVCLTTIMLSGHTEEIEKQHVKSNKALNPYDLEDELRAQLEELRELVQGNIYTAFGSLNYIVRGINYYRDDALFTAELTIQQEYETFTEQIRTLQDVAQTAGHNVGVCLGNEGPLLNQLPQDIIESLQECLAFSNREVTIIQNEATYRIGILTNEVNIFEFQLDLCASDFLCIEPLVTEIELAKANIPQKINLELQRASDLSAALKVSIQDCTNTRVSQFVTEGGTLVADITSCINEILS